MNIRRCNRQGSCGGLRCVRVIPPGSPSPWGYHARCLGPEQGHHWGPFIQVCPNVDFPIDHVTNSLYKATPTEVQAVMKALQTPEAADLLLWLVGESGP